MFHLCFTYVSLLQRTGTDKKTLRERNHAPTVFLNRSLSVFESLPQVFFFVVNALFSPPNEK